MVIFGESAYGRRVAPFGGCLSRCLAQEQRAPSPALSRPQGRRSRPGRGRPAAWSGAAAAAAPRDSPAGIISRSNEPRWASPEGQPQGPTAAAVAAEREREEGRREREGRSP